jgi:phospholipase/carboxylesterase
MHYGFHKQHKRIQQKQVITFFSRGAPMNQLPLNPIIINPKGEIPKYSLIFMHGLGASAHDFSNMPYELNLPSSLKMRFIFPNAPLNAVTINHGMKMPAWFDIRSLTDLDDEDEKGMRKSQVNIAQLIGQQIDQGISANHIFLGGFSQGAAIALLTGLQYEKPLAGIIALSGYLPLAKNLEKCPITSRKTLPIFIGHGSFDSVVPVALAIRTKNALNKLGYKPDYHTYNMAHQVSFEEMQDVKQWIVKEVS